MAETITMPKLGFDMREGVLVRWVKNEGETINKGDVLAEIETDKATVEVESSASGVVRKLFASQGDSIPVGNVIAIVGTAEEKIDDLSPGEQIKAEDKEKKILVNEPAQNTADTANLVGSDIKPSGSIKATPLARKIANEAQINLANIQGTGPGGRIVKRDLETLAKGENNQETVEADRTKVLANKPVIPMPYQSPVLVNHEDKTIQTSKLRQAIGRRLVESKQNLPHFYVSHEFKMEAIKDLRKQINNILPEGEKISVNDFIVKATALALRECPNLNSSLQGTEIVQHGNVNIGVAVTVPGGLLTIVVRDTDQKPIRVISAEIKNMAARARDGKVKPDDIDGSTFSTSNLGMYDVENFTAIINPPEAAILAIGSARDVPIVEDGQLKIGSMMKCTISVDHRISDGAEAAQFMQALARYIEDPIRLLL